MSEPGCADSPRSWVSNETGACGSHPLNWQALARHGSTQRARLYFTASDICRRHGRTERAARLWLRAAAHGAAAPATHAAGGAHRRLSGACRWSLWPQRGAVRRRGDVDVAALRTDHHRVRLPVPRRSRAIAPHGRQHGRSPRSVLHRQRRRAVRRRPAADLGGPDAGVRRVVALFLSD